MRVLGIFGPTGVGKTGVAVELAELLRERGEDPVAINCDALQVYEGLGTLTGVADADQRARLEHRLLEFVPVTADFNVGDYMALAHAEVDAALAAGRRPIVVGGTGLYLRAALADLSLRKAPPESTESELWSPETRHPTATLARPPHSDREVGLRISNLQLPRGLPCRCISGRRWATTT